MCYLRQNPSAIFSLSRRCRLVCHHHEFQRSIHISEELAQIGSARQPSKIAWAKVQHPLSCVLRVVIIAQLDVSIGQETVHKDVIRRLLIKISRNLQGASELVPSQQQ